MVEQYGLAGATASEITQSAENAIVRGHLGPGDRLPTVRDLADRLGVSPGTVATAYRDLARRGLVRGEGRRGTVVTPNPPLPTTPTSIPEGVRNLADGNPDPALLPDLAAVAERATFVHRLYGAGADHAGLLEHARTRLRADRVPTEFVTVTNGALDAVERVLMAHLRPGDTVAVEDPGFSGVLDLVRALGLDPAPVAIDDEGPRPGALDDALRSGAQGVVVTPRAQNPTGAVITPRRAAALRRVLRHHARVLVVEDDHAGPVAGAPFHTLADRHRARWAVIRSVSKWLGPDLRVAVVAADVRTGERVAGRRRLGPGWVSHVLQGLVADLWAAPSTADVLATAERVYRERRDTLIAALDERGVAARGRTGFNVWVPVHEDGPVARALLAAGYAVATGDRFRVESDPGIRITASRLPVDEAAAVAQAVADALAPAATTRWS